MLNSMRQQRVSFYLLKCWWMHYGKDIISLGRVRGKKVIMLKTQAYIDFCVALGKAGTFSSSPRAEFLSFDFCYDVYPKAAVSDKKERANPRVGVMCHRAQWPFPLPTELGQSNAPIKWCPAPVFPPKSFVSWNVSLCQLSTCPLSFVEKDAALEGGLSCSELGVHSIPHWALSVGGLERKPGRGCPTWSL